MKDFYYHHQLQLVEQKYLFFFQNHRNRILLLTEEHASLIARQERTYIIKKETINNIKKKIKRESQEYNRRKLVNIWSRLTGQEFRLNDINTEQGASTWLTILPIEDEGYMVNTKQFWNLVNIRYGWPLSTTSRTCACGSNFNIERCLTCKKEVLFTLRHNIPRNTTASLLGSVSQPSN